VLVLQKKKCLTVMYRLPHFANNMFVEAEKTYCPIYKMIKKYKKVLTWYIGYLQKSQTLFFFDMHGG
jgi:hypothetical protein